jgi:hypothetical protein
MPFNGFYRPARRGIPPNVVNRNTRRCNTMAPDAIRALQGISLRGVGWEPDGIYIAISSPFAQRVSCPVGDVTSRRRPHADFRYSRRQTISSTAALANHPWGHRVAIPPLSFISPSHRFCFLAQCGREMRRKKCCHDDAPRDDPI